MRVGIAVSNTSANVSRPGNIAGFVREKQTGRGQWVLRLLEAM